MIRAIFFDLDGTLLPIDESDFVKAYTSLLVDKAQKFGYESEQLVETLWKGVWAMHANDGSKTNEQVYWDEFVSVYGQEKLADKKIFDEFYSCEFLGLKDSCKENPLAREIVDFCKANVEFTVLTTNPIFPMEGQLSRISFLGLKFSDFDYITSYENSRFTKPNPKYFEEVMQKFELNPDEVILFGNNCQDDGECARKAGIKCYIVGDYVINKLEGKLDFPHISLSDIIPTIKKEIAANKQ